MNSRELGGRLADGYASPEVAAAVAEKVTRGDVVRWCRGCHERTAVERSGDEVLCDRCFDDLVEDMKAEAMRDRLDREDAR